jgi:hypothetical protein
LQIKAANPLKMNRDIPMSIFYNFTVAYLNATINVKPETENRILEPTCLAKPGETRGLTGTGLG